MGYMIIEIRNDTDAKFWAGDLVHVYGIVSNLPGIRRTGCYGAVRCTPELPPSGICLENLEPGEIGHAAMLGAAVVPA